MALNIKSPRVDALAREVAAMRKQTITQVVEAGLEALKRQEEETRALRRTQMAEGLAALTADLSARRGPDQDPRPLRDIREELWGGL